MTRQTRKNSVATKGTDFSRISIYIPNRFQSQNPLKRLYKLGQKDDRLLNHMIVKAVLDYMEREERKASKPGELDEV